MTIVIEGEQDMAGAKRLQALLLDSLAQGADVTLDLGGVTGADLAFLQLIESARRQAEEEGVVLAIAAPAPPRLRVALDAAGFLTAAADCPAARARGRFWLHGDLAA